MYRIDLSFGESNQRGMGKYVKEMVQMLEEGGVEVEQYTNNISIGFMKFKIWHPIYEQFIVSIMHLLYSKKKFIFPCNTAPFLIKPRKNDIYIVHDLIFFSVKGTTLREVFINLYYRFNVFLNIRRFEKIITVSETSKIAISKKFNINPEKIIVIYNSFKEKEKKTVNRKNYIFHVGGKTKNKNTFNLIEGFKRSSLYITHQLIVLGMDRTIESNDKIKFLPRISESKLENYYREAHFVVFPSIEEGFGRPLIEALVFNTPVLCNDIPIFHEIGKSHVSYANLTTPDSIADALDNFRFQDVNFSLTNTPYSYHKVKQELLKF